MLSVQILMAGCDLVAATLGVCGCGGSVSNEVEYQICAEEKIQSQTDAESSQKPKPKRLCRYYTNGTIHVPTLTVIESWIEVGSRLCIGDEISEPVSGTRTIDSDLEDQLSAKSGRPQASWEPGGDIEIFVTAAFSVEYEPRLVSGELLGQRANIRFTAKSFRWDFSDSRDGSGRKLEREFSEPGNYTARAYALISVDYQLENQPWVLDAFRGEVGSNWLEIKIIEIPRRTLLVET